VLPIITFILTSFLLVYLTTLFQLHSLSNVEWELKIFKIAIGCWHGRKLSWNIEILPRRLSGMTKKNHEKRITIVLLVSKFGIQRFIESISTAATDIKNKKRIKETTFQHNYKLMTDHKKTEVQTTPRTRLHEIYRMRMAAIINSTWKNLSWQTGLLSYSRNVQPLYDQKSRLVHTFFKINFNITPCSLHFFDIISHLGRVLTTTLQRAIQRLLQHHFSNEYV
jgi:sulfatase maturation enzyme AslB (radical SAM superfamily)